MAFATASDEHAASTSKRSCAIVSSNTVASPCTADVYLPSIAAHTTLLHNNQQDILPGVSQRKTSTATASNVVSSSSTPVNPQYARLSTQIAALKDRIAWTQSEVSSTLLQLQNSMSSSTTSPSLTSTVIDTNADFDGIEIVGPPDQQILTQAQAIVRQHIALLHRYNEIKDIGAGLMSLIADKDGKRLGDIMAGFGIEGGD